MNGQLDYANISSVKELCASIGEQKLSVAKKATSKADERFKEFDEKTDMKNMAYGIFERLKRFWGKRSKK